MCVIKSIIPKIMNTKSIFIMALLYTILMFIGCKQVKSRPESIIVPRSKNSFYDYFSSNPLPTINSIDGEYIDYTKFKAKKILILNVTSESGYTPQYKGLEELYDT